MYDKDGESSLVTTPVIKIKVGDQDGKPLSTEKVIFKQNIASQLTRHFNDNPSFVPGDDSGFLYHKYLYRSVGDQTCLNVRPATLNSPIMKYTAYFRKEDFPNPFDYDYKGDILLDKDWSICVPAGIFLETGIVFVGLKPVVHKHCKYSERSTIFCFGGEFTLTLHQSAFWLWKILVKNQVIYNKYITDVVIFNCEDVEINDNETFSVVFASFELNVRKLQGIWMKQKL